MNRKTRESPGTASQVCDLLSLTNPLPSRAPAEWNALGPMTTVLTFFIILSLNLCFVTKVGWDNRAGKEWKCVPYPSPPSSSPDLRERSCRPLSARHVRELGRTQSEYQVTLDWRRGRRREAGRLERPWCVLKPEFAGLKGIGRIPGNITNHEVLLSFPIGVASPC